MSIDRIAFVAALISVAGLCAGAQPESKPPATVSPDGLPIVKSKEPGPPVTIRVCTFNIEDVRLTDLVNEDGSPKTDQPRLKKLAEVIQRIHPTVLFLNEIAYDQNGAPGFKEGMTPGQNAQRFADQYLAVPQAPGLAPLRYNAFMAPVNTGMPSGFDLDNDGKIVTTFPPPPPAKADGSPGAQTKDGRAYGNDCWGFGTFPGQYGMALLIDPRIEIEREKIRTFRLLPWDYMPGAFMPETTDGKEWFSPEEKQVARLSSKSHWDVPLKLPNGAVVHMLCSHPTPPAFDGPENRNKKRNHDEIRFWADYIDGEQWIVDDNNVGGGLDWHDRFVLVGDLNADPKKGSSYKDPIGMLRSYMKIQAGVRPTSPVEVPGLDPDDTAMFKMGVDYVLPSKYLEVGQSGVWREAPGGGDFPSDHFPVWVDLTAPAPE